MEQAAPSLSSPSVVAPDSPDDIIQRTDRLRKMVATAHKQARAHTVNAQRLDQEAHLLAWGGPFALLAVVWATAYTSLRFKPRVTSVATNSVGAVCTVALLVRVSHVAHSHSEALSGARRWQEFARAADRRVGRVESIDVQRRAYSLAMAENDLDCDYAQIEEHYLCKT